MPYRSVLIGLLLAILLGALPGAVAAQSPITASGDTATVDFPNKVTFQVQLQSSAASISQVILEYGTSQLTCGTVIAKAIPQFMPGKEVEAQWTWEMQQSGSLPPGSTIWWRWHVIDIAGNEMRTEEQRVTWLDSQHSWEEISSAHLVIHWYEGGSSFGNELLDSADASLARLAETTGISATRPIDLYVYGRTEDLHDAVLYEPGWTGGLAYSDFNIVLIAISPDNLGWGKRAAAHELTHVLVGHLTFSCFGNIPTWLNEGLAVYGEGGWEDSSQTLFEQAVADDSLLSVRALSGGFSEDPAKADISYSQSYSIVRFLIEKYGQEKILSLLEALKEGKDLDETMRIIYGFDVDGLEDAWRADIGAQPRTIVSTPGPTPLPTPVPTLPMVSGIEPSTTKQPGATAPAATEQPGVTAPAATPAPTPVPATTPTAPTPASLPIPLLAGVGVGLILIVIAALVLVRRRRG